VCSQKIGLANQNEGWDRDDIVKQVSAKRPDLENGNRERALRTICMVHFSNWFFMMPSIAPEDGP
jgi:hypothetical protein